MMSIALTHWTDNEFQRAKPTDIQRLKYGILDEKEDEKQHFNF